MKTITKKVKFYPFDFRPSSDGILNKYEIIRFNICKQMWDTVTIWGGTADNIQQIVHDLNIGAGPIEVSFITEYK